MRRAAAWLLLAALLLLAGAGADRRPAPPSRQERGGAGLAELLAGFLPNTYYSRPKYRYPYYRPDGKATDHSHSQYRPILTR